VLGGVGHTGAVVGDPHLDPVLVPRRGGQGDRARVAQRVDRVVEQVGPDLVELGAVHADARECRVIAALDRDLRVLELVMEDRQRGFEPLVDVDLLQVGLVHVGVSLDRAHEARHLVRGVAQVVGQRARAERGCDPAHRRIERGAGVARDRLEPLLVEARGGERLGQLPRAAHAVPLEQLAHRVLRVGHGERVRRLRRRAAAHRVALQVHEPLGVLTRDARLDELPDRPAEHLERLAERRGAAARRGRRVVELVREARRHLAQRGQLLALHGRRLEARVDGLEGAHHALEGRPGVDQQAAEVPGLDGGHAAALGGADGQEGGIAGERKDRAEEGRRPVGVVALLAPVTHQIAVQRAREQEPERGRGLAEPHDGIARLEPLVPGRRRPALDLSVFDAVEEVDSAQLRGRDGHVSAKYWWMNCTLIEPSPTALATRLIERWRTSPATNTPGSVVSSRKGSRSSGQRLPAAAAASGPASTKPRGSRVTRSPTQSV
jgi:hypothetical protein